MNQRVVVDANRIFSELIASNHRLRRAFTTQPDTEFFCPQYVVVELFKHKERIAAATGLDEASLLSLLHTLLQRIPGLGLVYGSTKSLGDAFLNDKSEQPFKQVVLVQWPHPGVWRVGFITGRASADLHEKLGSDVEVVFVPHTPNPASGFVHYVPGKDLVRLDWPIEDGLKVIVSGGVAQPANGGGSAG